MRKLAFLFLMPFYVQAISAPIDLPYGKPDAIIDLSTRDGMELLKGQWRSKAVTLQEIDFRNPGPDLKPSGTPNRTWDLLPKAGGMDVDDSQWEVFEPSALEQRRGAGRLSFYWYRTTIQIPEKIGKLPTAGTTILLEVVVDDYAEVWVNGKLSLALGQTGGSSVRGFNAPNRVVLTTDARPGEKFQLAIFGANGPLSNPPNNFIWVRSATLDVYQHPQVAEEVNVGQIVVEDPAASEIFPSLQGGIEKLASGFQFTEGPVWDSINQSLLFSDPNENTIYRYDPLGKVSVFRVKSGYAGLDIGNYKQPGSNGLAFDAEGRLTINEHGRRRVVRLEKNGHVTVLADRYQGKRLNSPNDLVYRSDGSLYFTDPPFGLPKVFDDPQKELSVSGVYRWKEGLITQLTTDLKGPNGIAFSPDEKYLYVSNWDPSKKYLMRYPVLSDGRLGKGILFFDMGRVSGEDALDGIKVDVKGNVYAVGPQGIWVLSPEGKWLARIELPEHVANCAWGDIDGRSLYITASSGLYRIRLKNAGSGIHRFSPL